jgi:hypothetical protein
MSAIEIRSVEPWWTPERFAAVTAALNAALGGVIDRLQSLQSEANWMVDVFAEAETRCDAAASAKECFANYEATLQQIQSLIAVAAAELRAIRTDPAEALGI